jgi:hypothetical protein
MLYREIIAVSAETHKEHKRNYTWISSPHRAVNTLRFDYT